MDFPHAGTGRVNQDRRVSSLCEATKSWHSSGIGELPGEENHTFSNKMSRQRKGQDTFWGGRLTLRILGGFPGRSIREASLFSLKVTNLGNVFQQFLPMHLCKCLLLTFTSPSFFQVSTESVFLLQTEGRDGSNLLINLHRRNLLLVLLLSGRNQENIIRRTSSGEHQERGLLRASHRRANQSARQIPHWGSCGTGDECWHPLTLLMPLQRSCSLLFPKLTSCHFLQSSKLSSVT